MRKTIAGTAVTYLRFLYVVLQQVFCRKTLSPGSTRVVAVSHVTSFQKVISEGGAEAGDESHYSGSEYFIRFGIFCPKRCPRQKFDSYVTSTLAY